MTKLALQLGTAFLLAAFALGSSVRRPGPMPPASPRSQPSVSMNHPEELEVHQLSDRLFEVKRPRPDTTPTPCNFDNPFLPDRKDGVVRGLRLGPFQPNSELARVGLRQGDVVLRVNGIPIDTPEAMLRVYEVLCQSSLVVLDLEREGSATQYVYIVR